MQLDSIFSSVTAPDSLEHPAIQKEHVLFPKGIGKTRQRRSVSEVSGHLAVHHKSTSASKAKILFRKRHVFVLECILSSTSKLHLACRVFSSSRKLELNLAPSVCQEKTRQLWEGGEACEAAKLHFSEGKQKSEGLKEKRIN